MSYCNARLARPARLARLARLWLVYPHAQQQSRRIEERTRLRYVIHHETTIAKALLSDVLQLSHADADVRMVRCSGSFEGDQRIEVACRMCFFSWIWCVAVVQITCVWHVTIMCNYIYTSVNIRGVYIYTHYVMIHIYIYLYLYIYIYISFDRCEPLHFLVAIRWTLNQHWTTLRTQLSLTGFPCWFRLFDLGVTFLQVWEDALAGSICKRQGPQGADRGASSHWENWRLEESLGFYYRSGWWFQTFFIFQNIWDNPSHWLIFFKMVKTTNQRLIAISWFNVPFKSNEFLIENLPWYFHEILYVSPILK